MSWSYLQLLTEVGHDAVIVFESQSFLDWIQQEMGDTIIGEGLKAPGQRAFSAMFFLRGDGYDQRICFVPQLEPISRILNQAIDTMQKAEIEAVALSLHKNRSRPPLQNQ